MNEDFRHWIWPNNRSAFYCSASSLASLPSVLSCVLLCGYLTFPAKKGMQRANHIPWYDWLFMLLGAGAFFNKNHFLYEF